MDLRQRYDNEIRPLLDQFCIDCHGSDGAKAEVDFAYYADGQSALSTLSIWQRACRQVAMHRMPPEGEPQPSDDQRQRLLAWLKDVRGQTPPDPGAGTIRRLSRLEYDHTVRDLFGVDVAAGAGLADDSAGAAFDNSISPLLMEQYLLAADAVLDRLILPVQLRRTYAAGKLAAIRAGAAEPGSPDATQRRFSEPGEVWTMIDVPSDGVYSIKVTAGAEPAGGDPVRLGVRIGDRVVAELRVAARADRPAAVTCRCDLPAGRTRFAVVFMNPGFADTAVAPVPDAAAPGPEPRAKKKPSPPKRAKTAGRNPLADAGAPVERAVVIAAIEVAGPPAKPPSEFQKRLFASADDGSGRDAARAILAPFLARAFRRPPHADGVEGILRVFDLAAGQDQDFVAAVSLALKAILISPQFLFRTPDVADEPADAIVPVGAHELASRLSYFLWATMPDEALLAAAGDGTLTQTEAVAKQVRRLIADRRSRALAETFAASWLGLDRLAGATIDAKKYPAMTPPVRQAMIEEVLVFFDSLLREGGSILDLIDCDYTYVNAHTAKLYGLGDVAGPAMRRVALTDANRGGLIAMPAILTLTSRPDRTSPVKRGKWILETMFDAAPPPAPPNVPPLDQQSTAENAQLTQRQLLERHRTDVACAACHRVMDPLGFGLENFDAIGRWRTKDDHGGAIDAAGELPGGERFASPGELKRQLMARKDVFVRAFVARLLAFALGRELAAYDEVVLDRLVERTVAQDYRLDALIVDIATSYPFLNRRSLR